MINNPDSDHPQLTVTGAANASTEDDLNPVTR